MSLIFQAAAPRVPTDPQRADVACFIGQVGRRSGRPLPEALRAQLDAAGWLRGLWARPTEQIEALMDLPVLVDSWHVFDRYYAWDERPLRDDAGRSGRCATLLGAAVRAFFARGGRRAIIVRTGDPWPCLEDPARRRARRDERLAALLPDPQRSPATDPSSWHGIAHLHALPEVSLLLLPDLVELHAEPPQWQDPPPAAVIEPRGFAPCDPEPAQTADPVTRSLTAPRLDDSGLQAWRDSLGRATGFLASAGQRRALLVTSLPLPAPVAGPAGTAAQLDPLAWLLSHGVLQAEPQDRVSTSIPATLTGAEEDGRRPLGAFVQLGWPWLRSHLSNDLPGGFEPPEGTLAGLIASTAVQHGSFRSAAGERSLPWLRDLSGAEPDPRHAAGQARARALARRVCLIGPGPAGWELHSDVSAASDPAWRQAGACRLIGGILREARTRGEGLLFEPGGPRLWQQLRRSVEELLEGYWRAGALGGATPDEAYSVRCDRSTMSQNDLDAGRLIVLIGVRPAASIEQITVVLNLVAAAGSASSLRAEAA
ncbi:MAG: hypothetical protein RJA44_647 [Pseudomonadota bacterium]